MSNAFYVYLRDPDGHRIEIYTSDYFTGDPDHETAALERQRHAPQDFWGAAVVPTWYAEATDVLDLDGNVSPVAHRSTCRSRRPRSAPTDSADPSPTTGASMATFPHHADMVGSMLRPKRLAEARAAWREGNFDADELRSIEDETITDLVAKEEAVGLPAVTDGEFRRDWWHLDFLAALGGIGTAQRERPKDFSGEGESPPIPIVVGEVHLEHPIFIDAFTFLADAATTAIPKITIPGPGMANLMGGPKVIDRDVYPDLERFWDDLVGAYRDEVAALYAAGCRYLQMDDVGFAYLCDADFRAQMIDRGEDPDELVIRYRDAMNAAIADRPERHDRVDAHVPWQLPQSLGRERRLRTDRRADLRRARRRRLLPRIRQRAFRRLRAAATHGAGQDRRARPRHQQDAPSSRTPTSCASGSTRRPPSCRSSNSRSARSVASRAPTTATTSPRTTSGASSSWSSASPTTSGADCADRR